MELVIFVSTYNADFDGDEMNVHFPQDDISRAEAYNIVNANKQYVKPTNGFPIRALIQVTFHFMNYDLFSASFCSNSLHSVCQDHVVSAALLTKKDTFLRYGEFMQLCYTSGVSTAGNGFNGKPGKKVEVASEDDWLCPTPAIWKPGPLWTGKQVKISWPGCLVPFFVLIWNPLSPIQPAIAAC